MIDRPIGSRSSFGESPIGTEGDAVALSEQIEMLKADLAAVTDTLSDLVKAGVRERRTRVERTADYYSQQDSSILESMTPEEIEARLEAVEARTDTKFAELRGDFGRGFEEVRGEMKAIRVTLEPLRDLKTTVVVTGITSVLALGALIVGVLAYGGDRFGAGMDVGAIADAAADRAVQRVLPPQNLGVIDDQRQAPGGTPGQ